MREQNPAYSSGGHPLFPLFILPSSSPAITQLRIQKSSNQATSHGPNQCTSNPPVNPSPHHTPPPNPVPPLERFRRVEKERAQQLEKTGTKGNENQRLRKNREAKHRDGKRTSSLSALSRSLQSKPTIIKKPTSAPPFQIPFRIHPPHGRVNMVPKVPIM
ncbi:hypothetical protein TWF694_005886 [Orbilia ellipsospora]|uniref:Uncharacterized protein n=1 Tax=Orbilia ellipsospora TaxID=2528407 RepID=A0AAV9WTE9_9PEZI